MELDLRVVKPDEIEDFIRSAGRGFSEHSGDDHIAHGKRVIELDRAYAMFDGPDIVGTAASVSFEVTVPGGSLPMAGVAWVTVQPTHRRRGILRQMMTHQLTDVHERGEPLAGLWASESIIYGRFGYGMATFSEQWTIDKRHATFLHKPEQRGQIRFIDSDKAMEVFPGVYERVRSTRNGMIKRENREWTEEIADPEVIRQGASAFFFAVYECEGIADGFVRYRISHDYSKVIIVELMSVTDEAYAALWEFCFGIDLLETAEARNRPVDDPLIWMLADPRRLERKPGDAMWLRLVDAKAALSNRKYAQEGRLVIQIKDDVCPWNDGTFELEGGPGEADCRPTRANPDISLSTGDLAATYFGATPFRTLYHAGRVHENSPNAIELADSMFRTARQPWPTHDF